MDDALKAIREEYFASLESRYEEIAKDWTRLMREESGQAFICDLLRRVHNLVGSGALYGLEELSDTARRFEALLSQQEQLPGAANSEAAEQGFALLERLRTVMLNPLHGGTSLTV